MHQPVFAGRLARGTLEEAVEMLRILEAQPVAYLAYRAAGTEQLVLCKLYYLHADILLRRAPRLLLYQVAEIVGRQETLFGKISDRRQPLLRRLAALKVSVHLVLKLCQHVVVCLLAGDKLAFVKAHAVVEQHLYVAAYNLPRLVISLPFRLFLYPCKAVAEDFLLFLRQVESLARGVGEERISLYLTRKRCSVYKVGMEKKPRGIGL